MRYFVFLFLCGLGFSSCELNSSTGQIKRADGKHPAILKINKKIEATPNNAQLYFERALQYRELEQDSLALRDLDKALTLDTTQAIYYSTVGDLLFDRKDISGSIKWFQKAISINPNDEIAHLKVAQILFYTEDYPKAFAQINFVLKQNVHNAEAYFLKGLCYREMGELDKAVSNFQTAVQKEPKYYDGFMQLGLLYTERKDPLALQYFDNAIRVDSLNTEAHYAKAMFFQSQSKFEEAKAVFKDALLMMPDYAEAHYNMGFMLLKQDSIAKALREFERVLTTQPDNAKAYFNKGLCNEELGNFKEAKEDYEQALVFDPEFELPTAALKRVKKKL